MQRLSMFRYAHLPLALWLASPILAGEQKLKDSESASHAGSAAFHDVVDTYAYPGFKVVQLNLAVLSHYSYILSSGKEALVIDPDRDVDAYLDLLKKEGLTLKGVFLTHSHADFVAGHLELAKATGCKIYQRATSGAEYPFEPQKDGSTIQVGEATLKFIETPGHTPDGLCALIYGSGSKDMPLAMFTGDTLFVGSVGRPDLMGGSVSAAALASMMFRTWTEKLSKLPEDVVILPAHGAGSLCGAHLSDEPKSTIGAEKRSNSYLQHKARSDFIAAVLDGLPEAPQYFKHNATMNRKGPEIIDWSAPLPAEVAAEAGLSDPSAGYVVDLRGADEYAAGHIPGSVNIGLRGRLETWVGIMVPWEARLVLTGATEELKEAIFRLHRVGYKAQVIALESWKKAGLPLATNQKVKPADLYAKMQDGTAPVIVDVRLPSEWMGLRIGNVVNLPLSHLAELSSKIDPAEPVVTVCNSAYRSSLAVGVLERKGFKMASSLDGGSEAWIEAGLPVYGAETKGGAAAVPSAARRVVALAERISPAELKRLILDLPGTFDLVDIRPPAHFADYAAPGSINVDIADLLTNPAYLAGAVPLIVVDRDGSLAMMAAGILSQKTKRPVKALHGGLEAYWAESNLGGAGPGAGAGVPSRVAPVPPVPSSPAPAAAPAAPPTPKAKKKSAGC